MDTMSRSTSTAGAAAVKTASTRARGGAASQPPAARLFVAPIIAAGAVVLAFWGPRHVPNPILFATLLAASALASSLRLRVPLGRKLL